MTELLTSAQMRAIEAAAIASGAVTGLELMERAGRGVVAAVFAEWPELAAGSFRAVVLCGPGNNGGDGFVVARLLKEWDWEVEVFLYGDADKLPTDARANYARWVGMGENVSDFLAAQFDRRTDLLVDALFGTGLGRPLTLTVCDALDKANQGAERIVAVDIQSGVDADSGRTLAERDFATGVDLTVTFHMRKRGHYLVDGAALGGKVVVAGIGLSQSPPVATVDRVRLVGAGLPPLAKRSGHKYAHGHALVLSGPPTHGGAARLAARGALRIGAGLVTVGCPPEALAENAARLDAVMLRAVADGEALAEVLRDRRINALCLGPGLGLERARGVVSVALGSGVERRATVLDADALTAFAGDPAALFALLHAHCVLTPHGGEFARLFPDIAERLAAPPTKGPAYS